MEKCHETVSLALQALIALDYKQEIELSKGGCGNLHTLPKQ